MHMASFRGTGGCTFDSCFLSLLISSSVCRSRTGISPSESLSLKSNTDVSEELLNPLARAGTLEAIAGAGAGTGTVAATGIFSSSVLENNRLLGGKQATFSRVNFGGLPADEPDCGVDVEAVLSSSTSTDLNVLLRNSFEAYVCKKKKLIRNNYLVYGCTGL